MVDGIELRGDPLLSCLEMLEDLEEFDASCSAVGKILEVDSRYSDALQAGIPSLQLFCHRCGGKREVG